MKKVRILILLIVGVAMLGLQGCSSPERYSYISKGGYKQRSYDEMCENCGRTFTKEFKTANGTLVYYCEEHVKTCSWCSRPATRYYTSLLDKLVFVCDEHYKKVTGE